MYKKARNVFDWNQSKVFKLKETELVTDDESGKFNSLFQNIIGNQRISFIFWSS